MACGSCRGGGGKQTVSPVSGTSNNQTSPDMVVMEYIGAASQKQRLKSKVQPRMSYIFGAGQARFFAHRGDVAWLSSMANNFRVVKDAPIVIQAQTIEDTPVLKSEQKPPKANLPVDVLSVDPITRGLLKRKFLTINELKAAGRAEWLTIDGIGEKRADQIEEALSVL